MEHQRNDIQKGKPTCLEVPLWPPKVPRGLTWVQALASVLRFRWPSARANWPQSSVWVTIPLF